MQVTEFNRNSYQNKQLLSAIGVSLPASASNTSLNARDRRVLHYLQLARFAMGRKEKRSLICYFFKRAHLY